LVFIVAARLEGVYLAPFGFGTVASALMITVILAIGWMRTYWKGLKRLSFPRTEDRRR
jgi:hypothetical protein